MKDWAKMRKTKLLMMIRRRKSANLKMVRGKRPKKRAILKGGVLYRIFSFIIRIFSTQEHVSHFVVSQVKWTEGEIRLEV